jgi:hypothetical protein
MLATDPQTSDAVAVAYESTEEARLLLPPDQADLAGARLAVCEAAYYLSDTFEPDERAMLVTEAEARCEPRRQGTAKPSEPDALTLLCDAAGGVEEILQGPHASSELRIALRALRRAIGDLAGQAGIATNHLDPDKLRGSQLGLG